MDLKQIAIKCLKGFPLYNPEQHTVSIHDVPANDFVWVGYRTTESNQPHGSTHFDINIINGVFYILDIEVEKKHRGKGHGDALYKVLEEIARQAKCRWVQMKPSGWTHTGETRKAYLLRRGYRSIGGEAVKEL